MLIVLSPAKTLDFTPHSESDLNKEYTTLSIPRFIDHADRLVSLLKDKTQDDLQSLMKLSPKLGALNHQRYAQWVGKGQKGALAAFKGDVYQGLYVQDWSDEDWAYAQNHLRILSGLYGLLRPQDGIEAYRLEMGTRLKNPKGSNLYQFWDTLLQETLAQELKQAQYAWLLNLASNEYFKALSIRPKTPPFSICSPLFLDEKKGQFKVISFYAKKARGLLARYVIQNQLQDPAQLIDFNLAGYQYDAEQSSLETPVFIRFEKDVPKKKV